MIFALLSVAAIAQDAEQDRTPREQIIHDLGLNAVPTETSEDLPVKTSTVKTSTAKANGNDIADAQAPETALETIKKILNLTANNPSLIEEIASATMDIAEKMVSEPKPSSTKNLKPQKNTAQKKPDLEIAPFYLSAQDYLDVRGDSLAGQTMLTYEVKSGSVSGSGLGGIQKIALVLGEDYAAQTVGQNTTIYDFKLNRILNIKPEYAMDGKVTGQHLFENTSLYAKAYRDIAAVRGATKNGRLQKLDMGGGTTLDAFWVESAMSWAAGKPNAVLAIEKSSASLNITKDGEMVFHAEFSDQAFGRGGADSSKVDGSKNALRAFAHHEWPLHPLVLQALYAYDAPPKKFEMVSYGPTAPKGQKQIWTLVARTDAEAVFPLPPGAIGIAQIQTVSPLVFLIGEAANNRAFGGIKSVKDLTQDFNAKLDAEQFWQAWLVGQKYIAYSGSCKNPNDPAICKAVNKIEKTRKDDLPKRIQDYMTALNSAGRPGLKSETIQVTLPYLDKQETPAFIVRTAAMARAKMKSAQASAAKVSDINAETLLHAALAKDPYDPNTYVGLAQVLAAKGAFEQSWDIYDALRAGIATADSIDLKINRLEKNLRKTAPGYFLGD